MNANEAAYLLTTHGVRWWLEGASDQLVETCNSVKGDQLLAFPDVARWRALTSVLCESAEALSCLELAYAGHLKAGDHPAATMDAYVALALCLTDVGAMKGVGEWISRSVPVSTKTSGLCEESTDQLWALWRHLGRVARAVLDPSYEAEAAPELAWLHSCLEPLGPLLAPHERLLTGQVLVDAYFSLKKFEQIKVVAVAAEAPSHFDRAGPLPQARWLYTLGYAYYQLGQHGEAESAWNRAANIAAEHDLQNLWRMTSLAVLRLFLDRSRLEDAASTLFKLKLNWGEGRTSQLIQREQMAARLLLMRGRPAESLSQCKEALRLAEASGLPLTERASLHSDEAQMLAALDRFDEGIALLQTLSSSANGRDAAVYRCLSSLLMAWSVHQADERSARAALSSALKEAREVRYTMFLRLLPKHAGQLCDLALRWGIEVPFVLEVIRSRELPAPDAPDPLWPWPVWIALLGHFELKLRGEQLAPSRKPQQRPLDLLRLLACQSNMSMGMPEASDDLTPEAKNPLHSLEMTVERLRDLLGDKSLVRVREGVVSLDTQRVSSDVLQRRALISHLQAIAMKPSPDSKQQLVECERLARRLVEGPRGALLENVASLPAPLEHQRGICAKEGRAASNAARAVFTRCGGATLSIERAFLVEALADL